MKNWVKAVSKPSDERFLSLLSKSA